MLRKVDVLEFQIVQTISNKRNFDWFAPDDTRKEWNTVRWYPGIRMGSVSLRPSVARYHLCGRGYYRRRARKSTWRRTKGTLNALVTSTPRRPRCSPFPFFFPERILYPKHWKEKKCWREEGRKFTGERDRFRREIFKLIRNINFSLEECAFNNSRSEPFFVHIFKTNLGIYNSIIQNYIVSYM